MTARSTLTGFQAVSDRMVICQDLEEPSPNCRLGSVQIDFLKGDHIHREAFQLVAELAKFCKIVSHGERVHIVGPDMKALSILGGCPTWEIRSSC